MKGVIRSGFGGRSDPFSGEGAFHTGVDLAVVKGTSVHTTADGVVTTASWHTGYGKLVVVDHGNGFQRITAIFLRSWLFRARKCAWAKWWRFPGPRGVPLDRMCIMMFACMVCQ